MDGGIYRVTVIQLRLELYQFQWRWYRSSHISFVCSTRALYCTHTAIVKVHPITRPIGTVGYRKNELAINKDDGLDETKSTRVYKSEDHGFWWFCRGNMSGWRKWNTRTVVGYLACAGRYLITGSSPVSGI